MNEIYKISVIQFDEYVRIVSSFRYWISDKEQYNCKNKVKEFSKDKNNGDKKIVDFKNRNGCDKVNNKVLRTDGMIEFYTCYCSNLEPDFDYMIQMFNHYEKSIMPFSGGYAEQPNKVIELFNILSNLKNEYEKKEIEKANRESKKHGSKR